MTCETLFYNHGSKTVYSIEYLFSIRVSVRPTGGAGRFSSKKPQRRKFEYQILRIFSF